MAINIRSIIAQQSSPISTAPLALLRVLFGFVMTVSCVRFIVLGWIDEQYIRPTFHFSYVGFEWVTSLGAPGMYILYGVMTAAALGVMLGAWYRLSSVVFLLLFSYIELIDKTYYLNHYYFVTIIAFLFCLLPAHAAYSLDAWRKHSVRRETIPYWMINIFRLQITIVYVYAGIAKITSAWLIDAMPLRIWLPAQSDLPIIGPLLTLWWLPWVFAWAGMLFDVTIPFWLMWKKSRPYAYVAVFVFHIATGLLFPIGVFPYVMMAMSVVFISVARQQAPFVLRQNAVALLLGAFMVFQLLLPMRYVLYPGELLWTEDGYRFSWRVMLMEKTGFAEFTVEDRLTGRKGLVDNAAFLTSQQERQMSTQPDMILQYAHYIHHHYAALGMQDPKVTANVWVTLNGAPSKLLIDPTRDLSREELGLQRNNWVLSR